MKKIFLALFLISKIVFAEYSIHLPIMGGALSWKAPVANSGALPGSSNIAGDARITLNNEFLYVWSGSAWVLVGAGPGFSYLSSNTSVYGGTNSTLSFTGARDTVVGVGAGGAITTATDITLYGYQAGILFNANGGTIIGSQVAPNLTGGTGITMIGFQADVLGHLTNNDSHFVLIGSNGTITNAALTSGAFVGPDMVLGGGIANTGIGAQVTMGPNSSFSVAGGYQSQANGNGVVAIGRGSLAGSGTASFGVAVGQNSNATGTASVVAGLNSSDGGNANNVVLGNDAQLATSSGCFVVSMQNNSGAVNDPTTANNQIVFGSAGAGAVPLKDLFLGRGAVGDGTATNVTIQPSPIKSGNSNIAGATLTLLGGSGTGTGAGGAIIFKTSPIAGSGSTVNTQVTIGQADTAGIWTWGAASTTPQHVLNTATAANTNCGGVTVGAAGCIQQTINGVTHYIPYF